MTSLMAPTSHKVGNFFKLIYPNHYFNKIVDKKLKIPELLMAILLVYFICDITSGKKRVVATSKRQPRWKFWDIKHSFNLTFDFKTPSQIMPKKVFFMLMISSMTSQSDLKVAIYIHVDVELVPWACCKGNVSSMNANISFYVIHALR